VRSAKRKPQWVAPADQEAVNVSAGASVIISSFDPSAAGLLGATLVRSRGIATVRPQSFAADSTVAGAFGICVVSDDAFIAGTAAIPRPFDDADWGGWLVWRSFDDVWEFGDATGIPNRQAIQMEIDSKAMRKVGGNETVVTMCESQTGALNCAAFVRKLFLLA